MKNWKSQNTWTIIAAVIIIAAISLNFKKEPTQMLSFNDDNYEAAWRKIDSLDKKRLPASALKEVESLYSRAKKDNNAEQIVKTIIYREKYKSQLEEEGITGSINRISAEIKTASFPEKPLLQSILAELYAQYLNNNLWQFRNRTKPVDYQSDDVKTWTLEQLSDKAASLYLSALEDKETRRVALKNFEELLHKENKIGKDVYQTLYEFLAFRAIQYFKNDRSFLTQPAHAFQMSDKTLLAPVDDFVNLKINDIDSVSYKRKALLVYQELLDWYQNDTKNENQQIAQLIVDLERLEFVHQHTTLSNKDQLYLKALNNKLNNGNKDANVEIWNKIARFWFDKAGGTFIADESTDPKPYFTTEDILTISTKNPTNQWDFVKAKAAAKQAIAANRDHPMAENALNLISTIEKTSLNIQSEQVYVPNEPMLLLASYQNAENAYLRVIRLNEKREKEIERVTKEERKRFENQVWKYLTDLPSTQIKNYTLPNVGDYRDHRTELMLDPLPMGKYMLLISTKKDFAIDQGSNGKVVFQVSSMGYWHRRNNEERDDFTVFNRQTGSPIEGVEAQFIPMRYNSRSREDVAGPGSKTVVSDVNGFFEQPDLPDSKNGRVYYKLLLKKGQDSLDLNDRYNNYRYNYKKQKSQRTHFFTDRAIYRPGQTIYFKGLAIEKDTEDMPSILENDEVTVTFRDANYQVITTTSFKTNKYGTFNGSFTAPKGGLNGQMTLQSSIGNSSHAIRVEEYKRPKFEVNFEPVTGSFKLGELVTVTGMAKAFAGSNIDGATVNYRVKRNVRFPWQPYWYWRGGRSPYQDNSQQVAAGTTTTDAQGTFAIEFEAIPSDKIPLEDKPVYYYTIYADIVDITGETHSATQRVGVGTVAISINIDVDGKISADSLQSIALVTNNLNGTFEPTQGSLTIEKLNPPNKIFSRRYWQQPDLQTLDKETFQKAFPHLPYANENEMHTWPVQRKVIDKNFDTGKSKEISIKETKISAGVYKISVTAKDQFGTEIKKEHFVEVYDLNQRKTPHPKAFWHFQEQQIFEPKETANIWMASALPQLPVLYEVERNGKILFRKWLKVSQLNKENYTVQEVDRGNVHYHFSYAWNNRSHNDFETLFVPWSNKKLDIEYSTFRDKLQPGAEEEWILKIKGPNGEKVAAEMAATLYDASLDQFAANNWQLSLYPSNRMQKNWQSNGFGIASANMRQHYKNPHSYRQRSYPRLQWFGFVFSDRQLNYNRRFSMPMDMDGMVLEEVAVVKYRTPLVQSDNTTQGAVPAGESELAKSSPVGVSTDDAGNADTVNFNKETSKEVNPDPNSDFSSVAVRENLNETVFFYPDLMTDQEGNIILKFKMNEALTRWKLLGLAHTKDLKIGLTSNEVVTQKELMVLPNAPRFFREKDEIEYTAKVVNLSDKKLTGSAQFQLTDPMTGDPVFNWEGNPQFNSNFEVKAGESALLAWTFKVPDVTEVSLLEHTVLAKAGNFSDAERSVAPVLSNRMLVTETKPLPVRENSEQTFTLESLKNANSNTLTHEQFTLEFTSNPAWYAVQALPYLMEYPHECTEQIFSRFYANTLAAHVANSTPKIKAVFDRWRDYEPDALLSNLSKNQELKSALLEETPWVRNAQSEEVQKKQIALLFDLNRMSNEQQTALRTLTDRQLGNGGWSWFPGGRDNRYITQYLVEGFGHLQNLQVQDFTSNDATWRMIENAVRYIDDRIVEDYEKLEQRVQKGQTTFDKDHLTNIAIHYLYARSFFLQNDVAQANKNNPTTGNNPKFIPLNKKAKLVYDYYLSQSADYWTERGIYQNGMIALAADRSEKGTLAADIVKSLRERSLNSEEMGMYWKYNSGYFWYQAPVETHTLLIEVFDEVARDTKVVNDLKVWLLKNKQTNHWKTTKSTANAVYALLATGGNWLEENQQVKIDFPNANNQDWIEKIAAAQKQAASGTGYFKTSIDGEKVTTDLAVIQVKNPNNVPTWGAVYWQYFEDLDRIETFEETPLTIKKELFVVETGSTGEQLKSINNTTITPGDKIKVRVELRVDRDMEYVHLKDMRAAGLEPINVLSQYKWQDGLGYYESTRDVATDFFFSRLPKGTYVFEYPLRATLAGDFSNGITTAQCMYAPEFSSHSKGVRVQINKR